MAGVSGEGPVILCPPSSVIGPVYAMLRGQSSKGSQAFLSMMSQWENRKGWRHLPTWMSRSSLPLVSPHTTSLSDRVASSLRVSGSVWRTFSI